MTGFNTDSKKSGNVSTSVEINDAKPSSKKIP